MPCIMHSHWLKLTIGLLHAFIQDCTAECKKRPQAVKWPWEALVAPEGLKGRAYLGGPRASYFPLGTRLPLIGLLPLFP